jgi:Protein of unknown function (DUF3995)
MITKTLSALTAIALGGVAALHAIWATGSTFPFANREQLNDAVIGRQTTPSATACLGVAGSLVAASALVGGLPRRDSRLRRTGVYAVAATLGTRAVLGFAGRTDKVSPGSTSEHFRDNDRRIYSPLCLALACGAANSLRT